MPNYAVNQNAQANGDHEVHETSCTFYRTTFKSLGYHATCSTAVNEAKQTYPQSNGCYTCSRSCHTT